MSLQYITGDATSPVGEGNKLIIHSCNDIGAWGAGFVLALSNKWEQPESEYRQWAKNKYYFNSNFNYPYWDREVPFILGQVQVVMVEPDIYVANMIGQQGIRAKEFKLGLYTCDIPTVMLDALVECLCRINQVAKKLDASVHCPRFGTGLGGGRWEQIEPMLEKLLAREGIDVTVYDLPRKR